MKIRVAAFLPELLRHIFKRPATVQYPFEKLKVPDGFRGTPVLTPSLCIVCRACVRDCPAEAIEITVISEEEKRYRMVIHNDRCIHCAQCEEVCPTKAIRMNAEFELAEQSRLLLKKEYLYTRSVKKAAAQAQRSPTDSDKEKPAGSTESA